jgi:hypothetical protein
MDMNTMVLIRAMPLHASAALPAQKLSMKAAKPVMKSTIAATEIRVSLVSFFINPPRRMLPASCRYAFMLPRTS